MLYQFYLGATIAVISYFYSLDIMGILTALMNDSLLITDCNDAYGYHHFYR